MLPTQYNLTAYRGDDYGIKLNITSLGVPVDLSGATIIAQIRKSVGLSAPLILTLSHDVSGAPGVLSLSLTGQQTAKMEAGEYVYDVQIDARTYLAGKFILVGDVSREQQ